MIKNQSQAFAPGGRNKTVVKKSRREIAHEEVRRRAHKFLGQVVAPPEIIDLVKKLDPEKDSFENSRLKMELLGKKSSDIFQKTFQVRRKLPAMERGLDLLKSIKNHQVTLVVGSKGCGKTTQVPQMMLDEYVFNNRATECRIVCVQTAGSKAAKVAERVAFERNESLENSIGYQAKKTTKAPRENGSILFCTSGILTHKFKNDPFLQNLSAVILDDIHERPFEYTQVMALLAIILPFRPDMKVILLSPYVCKKKFGEFFKHFHTFHIDETSVPKDTKPPSITTVNERMLDVEHFRTKNGDKSDMSRFKNDELDNHLLQAITAATKTDRGVVPPPQNISRFMDRAADNSFKVPAKITTRAHNVSNDDVAMSAREKKDENEYRCSIAFLWMYADSDLSSISEWDKALITKNRQRIISFERMYPQLVSGADDTGILLEKTKLNSSVCSVAEPVFYQKGERTYRGRSEVSTSVEAVKRPKPDDDSPTCAKKQRTLNSIISDSDLQVAIVDWSDPDGHINPAKWLQLEEKLLTEMISDKWTDEIISFDGAKWSGGVKVVKCGDERSLEFLKVTVASIGELWPRAQLGVIPQSVLPLRTYVKMWIPPPVPSMRNVFELLGKQNEGLVTEDWQIISSTPCKNDFGTEFRLAIDGNSLKRLKECQGRARFGFGFINIQPE